MVSPFGYQDMMRRKDLAKRFPYTVEIGRHPHHKGDFGDPRKSWYYECIQNPWAADDHAFVGRVYYFSTEQDSLMFFLRWDGEEA